MTTYSMLAKELWWQELKSLLKEKILDILEEKQQCVTTVK